MAMRLALAEAKRAAMFEVLDIVRAPFSPVIGNNAKMSGDCGENMAIGSGQERFLKIISHALGLGHWQK